MNVIYVDDEAIQLENFRLTVQGLAGIDTLQLFSDSVQALEWAKSHPVDAAFLDIEMPKLSGLELAKQLKALNRRTGIVFVTAYDQYALDAFSVRASGYLLKPYTRTDVEAELENLGLAVGQSLTKKICITTMPDFLVTVNGKNIFKGHSKQEELFALLVDRGKVGITKNEALLFLGDGAQPSDSAYWSWLFRLKNVLEEAGVPSLLIAHGNARYLDVEQVDCDLYRMQAGDENVIARYTGQYMRRYAWAEGRIAELDAIRRKTQKNFENF